MPKIWRISHSDISDNDHDELINNNLLAIGSVTNMENGVTTIRDRFQGIQKDDYFYLVRRGSIVLFGQFGEIEKNGVINENMDAFEGEDFNFSDNLNGWLCRKFEEPEETPYASNLPFLNNRIKCDARVGKLHYMPSGQSTVFEVPIDKLGQFEKDVLKPVFGLSLEQLQIEAPISPSNTSNFIQSENIPMISLNQILFGPPGTGKTYSTVSRAMQIFNNIKNNDYLELKNQFDVLKSEVRIEFITFHQSFSYEDFVEGIRAETNEKGELNYSIKDGIFKKIAIEALYSKFEELFKDQLQKKWQEAKDNALLSKLKTTEITIDTKFDQSNYEHKKLILSACKLADFKNAKGKGKPYVLIIDEINRGNTSRVFGELITLVETTKRAGTDEAMDAILPYSQETFTVPDNLYIIGTMNTADRSLALMDTALRRRFDFIEMMPKPELIKDINIEEIDLELMLQIINDRIEALYDREHTIGHAFFMKLTSGSKVSDLALIFKNNILPLLEEYFFEDWEKITKVLGKSNIYIGKNFDNLGFDYPGTNYSRNDSALENKDTYINIYTLKDIDSDQAQSE